MEIGKKFISLDDITLTALNLKYKKNGGNVAVVHDLAIPGMVRAKISALDCNGKDIAAGVVQLPIVDFGASSG